MKSSFIFIAFAVLFLFFIQLAGTLVESIYILDLLNTALDEKALGLLFFFSPLLLVFFRKKAPGWVVWLLFGMTFVDRGMMPYLDTEGRLLASGIGTSAVLLLFPLLINSTPKGKAPSRPIYHIPVGLALGVGFSVLLRTVNFSIDYSLTPAGSWTGWGLGILLGTALAQLDWTAMPPAKMEKKGVTSATFGIILVLTLVYFVFSAPGVIARWTEGNYPLIVAAVSLMTLGWAALTLSCPSWLARISPRVLLAWNLLFTCSLAGTILVNRVPFPLTPDSPPVIIASPSLLQQIPLFFTLLLFPVIFLDAVAFTNSLQDSAPSPRTLMPGMLLGSLAMILLMFMNIFTNVWGYVEPVSPFFRNKFWLPFALIAGSLTILGILHDPKSAPAHNNAAKSFRMGWNLFLGVVFIATAVSALRTNQPAATGTGQTSLLVMTYNIQQANDSNGEKSYDRQLALIRRISPDILALQESDSARISLNNNDYVRYFAGKLGYFSYYGPTTVSGTYGTAILSRFPLQNTHSVFSYSNQDEIGTAVAEIEVNGQRFTIFDVHPDGSDAAKVAFAKTLLARSSGKLNVIALGDYNSREDEIAYQMIDAVFTNAWISFYPTGISDDGIDMSGKKRIDHILISPDLNIRNPVYLLPPASFTDHPAHWAEIFWEE